jgi:hypothetical protein
VCDADGRKKDYDRQSNYDNSSRIIEQHLQTLAPFHVTEKLDPLDISDEGCATIVPLVLVIKNLYRVLVVARLPKVAAGYVASHVAETLVFCFPKYTEAKLAR